MKTTAIGILAVIFGAIATILGQTNQLHLSMWFGVIFVILLVISLIVHNQETKPKSKTSSVYDERTKRGDKQITKWL